MEPQAAIARLACEMPIASLMNINDDEINKQRRERIIGCRNARQLGKRFIDTAAGTN